MLSRAAPRPTRSHGPWEGVRPRPGAGQSQHFFFRPCVFAYSVNTVEAEAVPTVVQTRRRFACVGGEVSGGSSVFRRRRSRPSRLVVALATPLCAAYIMKRRRDAPNGLLLPSRLALCLLLLLAPVTASDDMQADERAKYVLSIHSEAKVCDGKPATSLHTGDHIECARYCFGLNNDTSVGCHFFSFWGECYPHRCKLFHQSECGTLKMSKNDCVRTYSWSTVASDQEGRAHRAFQLFESNSYQNWYLPDGDTTDRKGWPQPVFERTPNFESFMRMYAAYHSVAVREPPHHSRRYLVLYPGHTGWGNRVRALLSWLMYAMLHKVVFLVHWERPVHWGELLSSRLQLDAPTVLPDLVRQLGPPKRVCAPCTPHGNECGDYTMTRKFDSSVWTAQFINITSCEDMFFAFYDSLKVDYRQKWFNGDELAARSAVFRFFFEPAPAVARLVLPVQANLEANAYAWRVPTIGLHIRTGSEHTSWVPMLKEGWQAQFLECARQVAANATTNQELVAAGQKPKVVFFLATDDVAVSAWLDEERERSNAALDIGVHAINLPIVHSGLEHEVNGSNIDESGQASVLLAQQKVVADWWLLGLSDHIIGTRTSSFGWTAVWLRSQSRAHFLPEDMRPNGDCIAQAYHDDQQRSAGGISKD